MRYGVDDHQLPSVGDDEVRAEQFLAGLRVERRRLASWGADQTAIAEGLRAARSGKGADETTGRGDDAVSWRARPSARLVRRAPEEARPAWERPMLVRDVMRGPIASVAPATGLEDVAALMNGLRVPWVVVEALSETRDGEVVRWQVISDVDLLRATTAPGLVRTAGSIATLPPLCIDVKDDLARASAALLERDLPCAMVVQDGLPAGLLSASDIAAVWAA